MLIIKHINGMYDVFSGVGYDLHTRLQRQRDGSIMRFVSGQRLPRSVVQNLQATMNPEAHYQKVAE